MKHIFASDNSKITIEFDEEERQIVSWMLNNFSSMEFINYVHSFINQRRDQMHDTLKEATWSKMKHDSDFHALVLDKTGLDIATTLGVKKE